MTHLRLISILFLSALSALFVLQPARAQQSRPGQQTTSDTQVVPPLPRHSPDFKTEWKQVDSLRDKRGKVRSAADLVWRIQATAKKEGNETQVIKSLLYLLPLTTDNDENADSTYISLLETETASAGPAPKAILQSLTAEAYWDYFQSHRYQMYGRTNIRSSASSDIHTSSGNIRSTPGDIHTWTAGDFHEKIAAMYTASIKDESLLQKTSLAAYDPILEKGNTRNLRPTLFDLLANRALAYFSDDERDITRPSYAFVLDDALAFAPANIFIHHPFYTKDSTSLQWHALLVYQKLLAFHETDEHPDALIDADLGRLAFVSRYSTLEQKGILHKNALQRIADMYPNQAASAQAVYLLAEQWQIGGLSYSPLDEDTTHRYDINRAIDLCTNLVRRFPSSEGGIHAKELLTRLLTPSIQLQAEAVNIPDKPFRALVRFKNVDRLYCRLVPYRKKDDAAEDDEYRSQLLAQRPLRQWTQSLPATGDHQFHSAETKIDALPAGEYMLIEGAEKDFRVEKNPMVFQHVYVSAISYIASSTRGYGTDYLILDRESGQPLNGATVRVWSNEYSYSKRTNKLVKKEQYTADEQGHIRVVPLPDNYRNIQLDIHYKNDHLFTSNGQSLIASSFAATSGYVLDSAAFEQKHATYYLFTDRGIYRPGQTLYFKGIGITSDPRAPFQKSKLFITADSILVYLQNGNGQRVDSLLCAPNNYGSIRGIFHLPSRGLTGQFNLIIPSLDQQNGFFSVEEYKRPQFEVELNSIKGAYRLEDTVALSGLVKAYAGNAIGGARVAYNIIRNARFPYRYFSRGRPSPAASAQQIAQGNLTTAMDGSFSLRFKAIPDLSVPKDSDAVFDYLISLDVTDMNGETQNKESSFSVGYRSLELNTGIEDGILNADSLRHISVRAVNLAGQPQTVSVTIHISQLASPERLIRSRYWDRPDLFTMDEASFIQSFPHDEYRAESDFQTWPVASSLVRDTFTTGLNRTFDLSGTHFNSGVYRMEVNATDSFGVGVKQVTFFQVYDPSSMKIPYPAYQWVSAEAASAVPGSIAIFEVGSAPEKGLFVISRSTRPQNPTGVNTPEPNIAYSSSALPKDRLQKMTFPITENDRGGFVVSRAYVVDNRFYKNNFRVDVPWDNKELQIEYKTYREKTEPGSPEIWTATVRGKKGEVVSAEVLAGMYDASLDPFRSNTWNIPFIYPDRSVDNPFTWEEASNFSAVNGLDYYQNNDPTPQFNKIYENVLTVRHMVVAAAYGVSRVMIRGGSSPLNEDILKSVPGAKMKMLMSNQAPAFFANGNVANFLEPAATPPITTRKNFNETAFFFPDLHTDSSGRVSFSFTMPEALTRWNLQTLAHTRDLAFGLDQRTIITQKTLMLQPNMPRFLREGDQISLSIKIASLDTALLTGVAHLELLDAMTMEPLDREFHNNQPAQTFKIAPGQSVALSYPISIPDHFDHPLTYRLVASAGNFSDGEEASFPILPKRILVTESLPLLVQGDSARTFRFDRLLQQDGTGKSGGTTTGGGIAKAGAMANTARPEPYRLTLEYCSNPAWYAIQAIPSLMEFPYECSEQTFNRYYANTLAAYILEKAPRIQQILRHWAKDTSKAGELLSNLQKDQELKSVLLQETPWVLQADNEAGQKQRLAELMDMTNLADQQSVTLQKIISLQTPNGGFAWFSGGPDDRYITQYIVSGIGHLTGLHALPPDAMQPLLPLLKNALSYIDARVWEDYKTDRKIKDPQIGAIDIQYLYARSFFRSISLDDSTRKATNFYESLARKQWVGQRKYLQGMIALALHRSSNDKVAVAILSSLEETSINMPDKGRYWKSNAAGWYWYESPIEAQALLIEAFTEIGAGADMVNSLRTWLLTQKQTQAWPTTKATADACYALLLQGNDWLGSTPSVQIRMGDTLVDSRTENTSEGTGYFKKHWNGSQIEASMGAISVTPEPMPSETSASATSGHTPLSWGAVYYQYFQDIGAVTAAQTELSIKKEMYIVSHSGEGEEMHPITQGKVHIGDIVRLRLIIRSDRDLDYVHLRDLRASCLEPVSVLSGYQWKGDLGYYQSTLDASTNFFFSNLPKGTHLLEYDLKVAQAGIFSAGMATLECQYAPQFSSHSEGTQLKSEP